MAEEETTFEVLYRAIKPDGSLWIETHSLQELVQQSRGVDVIFQIKTVKTITVATDWETIQVE